MDERIAAAFLSDKGIVRSTEALHSFAGACKNGPLLMSCDQSHSYVLDQSADKCEIQDIVLISSFSSSFGRAQIVGLARGCPTILHEMLKREAR